MAAVAAVGGGAAAQELAHTLTAAADMAADVPAERTDQGDLLAGDLLSLLQQPSCWDLPEGEGTGTGTGTGTGAGAGAGYGWGWD